MRTPGDAHNMGESKIVAGRSTPTASTTTTSTTSSSTSNMMNVNGRSSPLTPSPQTSPALNTTRRTMGRSQLSIQELQELAEKQRAQILYSSKELMDKQQLLMKMHNDFRSRLKIQNGVDPVTKSPRPPKESRPLPPAPATKLNKQPQPTAVAVAPPPAAAAVAPAPLPAAASPRTSPRPPKSCDKREADQYAKMLRETYNNMGKLQNRGKMTKEVDIKKLSNVELSQELKKVRAIFSLKQNELAEAVKKVDVLTQELEKRKHGDSGSTSMSTPERINRRKKIQAAKDELDRLRNELIVRNEMNTQQSQQLQLQRDIIHEKQQELRELNTRINELGNALLKQHAASSGGRPPPQYPATNNGYPQQRLFTGSYLYDTLNRKRAGSIGNSGVKQPNLKYSNSNPPGHGGGAQIIDPKSLNDVHNRIAPSPSNEFVSSNDGDKFPPAMHVDPPHIRSSEERSPTLNVRTDITTNTKSSQLSPTSSVSSRSSNNSSTTGVDERFVVKKSAPPPPPPRTVTVGKPPVPLPPVAVVTATTTKPSYDDHILTILQPPVLPEKPKPPAKVVPVVAARKPYSDSTLSSDSDQLRYEQYSDAGASGSRESLQQQQKDTTTPPVVEVKKKPPPPPVKPKPVTSSVVTSQHVEEKHEIGNKIETTTTSSSSSTPSPVDDKQKDSKDDDDDYDDEEEDDYDDDDYYDQRSETTGTTGPSEPEDFELAFADIDEINESQTDLWSNSDSTMSNDNDSNEESDFEDISQAIVPVVISISPDKMPPPILMWPELPRKDKRNVVLDPFILLLDAALEGEMDTVKSILRKVPDPSRPNPEGITALHNAVCGNHKDVVRYLVEVACDINSADNNGWTPLHCAAFYNDTELCQYLVQHGASVFATTYTDYQTPAHKCSRLDENYDVCFGYLHECKENVGRSNNGLVHALYDYVKEHEDELSFSCGEELTVLRRGDTNEKEWWWARNRSGDAGYIPCNLVGNFPRIAAVV
jgi:hypothetical protein